MLKLRFSSDPEDIEHARRAARKDGLPEPLVLDIASAIYFEGDMKELLSVTPYNSIEEIEEELGEIHLELQDLVTHGVAPSVKSLPRICNRIARLNSKRRQLQGTLNIINKMNDDPDE